MKIKKISGAIVLMAAVSLLLSSCEEEKPLNELIIGKWGVQSVKIVEYANTVKKTETTYFLGSDEMALQFAEGGTGISYENGDVLGMFNWSLNGNILTLGSDTEWIVTIDGDTLVWSYTETEVIENVTYKYEFFFTATRTD
jgi:hypothetical protein